MLDGMTADAATDQWKRMVARIMIVSTTLIGAFVIYLTFFPYVCYHTYCGSWVCGQLFPLYVPFDDFLKAHDSYFSQHVWKYLEWVECHLYRLG
jgi:hypothetical protein